MNKKGFTLIELLSIIVLIGLIASLSFTVVTKKLRESKERLYNSLIADLKKSGEKYILDNEDLDKYHINTLCISLSTLQQKGFLEKGEIKDPRNKDVLNGYIQVKFDGKIYKYDYVDNCTEKIITPIAETILAKEKVKVSGSESGLYETTDSYIYKGTSPKNYIRFNNVLWRIVSIDKETMTIKIINTSDNQKSVTEDGFVKSLNDDFETGSTYNNVKDSIDTNSKWNIGKVNNKDSSQVLKTIEKQSNDYYTIGLLTVGEFIDASVDKNCYKTNDCASYLPSNKSYWLLNTTESNQEWYVSNGELDKATPASQIYHVYPVIQLKINSSISSTGQGTESDPYIVEDYTAQN